MSVSRNEYIEISLCVCTFAPAQALPSMRVVPVMPRMRVLALSGVGNIIGSLLMVGGVVAMQIFPEGAVATSHVAAMAATKCSAPIFSTFIKGIGANWLVATAIFQATVAQTGPGKVRAEATFCSGFLAPLKYWKTVRHVLDNSMLEHSAVEHRLSSILHAIPTTVTVDQVCGSIFAILKPNLRPAFYETFRRLFPCGCP